MTNPADESIRIKEVIDTVLPDKIVYGDGRRGGLVDITAWKANLVKALDSYSRQLIEEDRAKCGNCAEMAKEIKAAVDEEREECARVAEDWLPTFPISGQEAEQTLARNELIATAIRERKG